MRTLLLLSTLALAACSKVQAEQPKGDSWEQTYNLLVADGDTPAEARKAVEQAKLLTPTAADEKRFAAQEAERQNELSEIRNDACKNDPGISYC